MLRFYGYAVAGRSNRCLHRRAAVLRCNVHCSGSGNLAGSVSFANRNVSFFRYVQLHLAACGYVFAYQDVAFAHSHAYIIACGDGFTYGNITGARLRNHVARHVHVPFKLHIAFIIYRHGQVLLGQGIIRYIDTAVRCMQGQVETRIQLTVMGDHDILGSGAVLRVIQRFYRDTAFLGLRGTVHGNSAVRYLQADIVLGQDCVFCLHFANLDITVIQIHGYAAAGGCNRRIHRSVAILRFNLYITAGGKFAVAALFADDNTAVFRLHGHVLNHGDFFIDENATLPKGLCIIVTSRDYLVRHMEVAVHHDHGGVVTGLHFAVMIDDNVRPGFARYIGLVAGQYGSVPRLCGGLAGNCNFSFFSGQAHILVGRNRLHIRAIVADEDIPIPGGNFNAAFLSRYGLHDSDGSFVCPDGNISVLGQDIAIVPRFRIAYDDTAIMRGNRNVFPGGNVLAYQDIAVFGLQRYRSLGRVDGFPDGDVAFVRGNTQIIRNIYISVKNDAALLFNCGIDTLLGLNIVRNMDIAVPAVQVDASAGDQFAVIPDDEVSISRSFFILILSGCHGDIAGFRGCLAQNVDCSEVSTDCNILVRLYRFSVVYNLSLMLTCTAYGNVALARLHRYTFFRGLDALGNLDVALLGFKGNILLRHYRCFGISFFITNSDVAFVGNSCGDLPGFSYYIAFQINVAISVDVEIGVVSRPKHSGSACHRRRVVHRRNVLRQCADVNTGILRSRVIRLNNDVMTCRKGFTRSAYIINRICY